MLIGLWILFLDLVTITWGNEDGGVDEGRVCGWLGRELVEVGLVVDWC